VLEAHGEEVFVVACDMPCVDSRVINRLFDLLEGYDAVIPTWNGTMLEPLHAVYKKEALVQYLRSHESLSLRDMVRSIHSRYVSVRNLQDIDPKLTSFTNINKIEDLEKITRS
jgi:molybdopterin-guanine dinucleotide biosynthesis protein A